MKKNEYSRPDEIYVDGEKVKFHYNREERLKKAPYLNREKNEGFFSKKYRYLQILTVDIILIFLIGVFANIIVGKSNFKEIDGFKYFLSRKTFSSKNISGFNIQIKNISKTEKKLKSNYIYLKIYNQNNELVFSKDIFISKLTYKPEEYFLDFVVVNDLKEGKYKTVLEIDLENRLELDFKVK